MMNIKEIRLFYSSLIFLWLLLACGGNKTNTTITIQSENGKATSIVIPRHLLEGVAPQTISQSVQVRLQGDNQPPIFGEYSINDDSVLFRPLIPFTPGLTYVVAIGNKILGQVTSAPGDPKEAPKIIGIVPMPDTLPENLLKLYIRFSKPMQEGQSLQHITLIRNGRDTVNDAFLDLDRELWNPEHDMLTLWFDPGRLKRGLQPNLAMGPPLRQGEKYQLTIHKNWRDASGAYLDTSYTKDFIIGRRDSLSPDPHRWGIEPPLPGSLSPMKIYFMEPLDYVLLGSTIRIIDSTRQVIQGTININEDGTVFSFTPAKRWKAGKYTIEIDSHLEDLAGNTLDHLFDNDLTAKQQVQQEVYRLTFVVQFLNM